MYDYDNFIKGIAKLRDEILNDKNLNEEDRKDDYDSLENGVNRFIDYFNAVLCHVMKPEALRPLVHAGYMEPEELREIITELDSKRKLSHDLALHACVFINRACDIYHISHICPEVSEQDIQNQSSRSQIANFVGTLVYNMYQRGIHQDISMVQKDLNYSGDRMSMDAAFVNGKKDVEKGSIDVDHGYPKVGIGEIDEIDIC